MERALKKDQRADVLVLGAGMAGLCAAVAALEQGAQVLVLEKGNRWGGSMALSNGIVWTFAPEADLRRHVPDGDAALQDLLVTGLGESLRWLEGQGVELRPDQDWLGHGRGQEASPPQMTAALVGRIESLGGQVVTQTAVQSLITRDGVVAGVLAFDAQGGIEIQARSVILATGGFQGNAQRRRRPASAPTASRT